MPWGAAGRSLSLLFLPPPHHQGVGKHQLLDLLMVVPFSYWRLHAHPLVLTIVAAVDGVAILSLFGIVVYLRRRGS